MNLVRYELRVGFFKGLLIGIRHYPFYNKDSYEEDIVIYVGIFQIIITKFYET